MNPAAAAALLENLADRALAPQFEPVVCPEAPEPAQIPRSLLRLLLRMVFADAQIEVLSCRIHAKSGCSTYTGAACVNGRPPNSTLDEFGQWRGVVSSVKYRASPSEWRSGADLGRCQVVPSSSSCPATSTAMSSGFVAMSAASACFALAGASRGSATAA
jgi:hypothetical protein